MDMDTLILENQAAERIAENIYQLPPIAQREISDYIEFLLQKYRKDKPKKPFFGCMKGTVTYMSDDFNAPLDDFKEYME
jgi:hypothetical protein